VRFHFDAPSLPASTAALRAATREFLRDELAAQRFVPLSNGWMRFDAGFTLRCAAAGFVGMTFPPEYGGQGRTALERYIVYEELLAAGAPLGAHWIADRQSGPQVLRHGSDAARRTLLPAIAAGRCSVGIGMSEADAGSDLAAVRTRGTRCEGGWRLTGTKLWSSHAHQAHYMIVLARTAPLGAHRHSGLTQFIVDTSAEGYTANPLQDLAGGRDFNEIVLDEVFVPDAHVLGAPGEGWKLVTGELAFERSGPDRFLSSFPLLLELLRAPSLAAAPDAPARIGRLFAHVATLRRMSMAVAGMLDRGLAPSVEAAIVKDLGTAFEREIPEIARLLAPVAADASSADAYAAGLAVATLTAPSYTLRGGTREILRGIVARELGLR
jgi:alkylation response protein AidB-like acyl-CoA dehydrogenase